MATLKGLEDPDVQNLMQKHNGGRWDPHVDRNMLRAPDRMIHVFSTSPRTFIVDRAPLWIKLHLKGCRKGERFVPVAHIPDPLMQAVHDVEKARKRGEANDGMLCAIELLNPNNPTYDMDWTPSAEMAAAFSSSKGCDLISQGLFLSLHEEPLEEEIAAAERRRDRRRRQLIAHADSLEHTNRKELEEFIKSEDGTDLRIALDYFGQQREYHKPMIATQTCPNCGESMKSGAAFHLLPGGIYCVNDWPRAVEAGVKVKSDVPEGLRWWSEEEVGKEASDFAAPKRKAGRPQSS